MKYIAFNPDHPGVLIPDIVLANIIDAALRGKMTEAGEKLLLLPDKRHGAADSSGLRLMRRVKKSECITLKRLAAKSGCHAKGKNQPRNPLISKGRKSGKTPTLGTGIRSGKNTDSRDNCQQCGKDISHMRRGTKFCSSRCRKRASRSENIRAHKSFEQALP